MPLDQSRLVLERFPWRSGKFRYTLSVKPRCFLFTCFSPLPFLPPPPFFLLVIVIISLRFTSFLSFLLSFFLFRSQSLFFSLLSLSVSVLFNVFFCLSVNVSMCLPFSMSRLSLFKLYLLFRITECDGRSSTSLFPTNWTISDRNAKPAFSPTKRKLFLLLSFHLLSNNYAQGFFVNTKSEMNCIIKDNIINFLMDIYYIDYLI